jgi:melanoma-associated antigen p97
MSLLLAALTVAGGLAGCTVHDETLRLAVVQPDDALEPAKDPQRLAAAIAAATGRETALYYVESTQLALQSVSSGQADAAFVDGAAGWLGWQRFGLEAVAATLESDDRTHYVAAAWVLNASRFQQVEDLRGADSCHTGLLKSAGMFMPLGWLIRNGYVDRVGPDDVASIEPTADAFFGTARIPRSDADPYGNYAGALRCLSEGLGEVAFGKDTTPATFCVDGAAQDWCLGLGEYRLLAEFGTVPSHPVMVGPHVDGAKRGDLVTALVALTASAEGKVILSEVLGSRGYVAVESSEAHLGEYVENIQHVPGMMKYVESSLD